MLIYNSLSRKKEEFVPYNPPNVGLYTCGFTVYDHPHIGNIKKYIGDDILRRVLEFNEYKVKHVQNVTDVGHLESDADEGEDKLQKGARKYNLDVFEVARKFETEFYNAMDEVNVLRPHVIERAASDKAISEQIKFINELLMNGYAYVAEKAIYFDVKKLPDYNPFSNQTLEEKLTGSRADVVIDPEKRGPADFALWVFTKGEHINHAMRWESPWGPGFPGWHIECSAIGLSNLGPQIDIHTGGVDHKEIHHPNEIAQNYGVTGKQVVKYWVHHEFLLVDGRKMSKSLNNFYTLADVKNKGFDLLALRYLILQTHYRQKMNFTWEALSGAQRGLNELRSKAAVLSAYDAKNADEWVKSKKVLQAWDDFVAAINDDLNVPKALGELQKGLNTAESDADTAYLLAKADEILGLNLKEDAGNLAGEVPFDDLPKDVQAMVTQRMAHRQDKNWAEADKLRGEIEKAGFKIDDIGDKIKIFKV